MYTKDEYVSRHPRSAKEVIPASRFKAAIRSSLALDAVTGSEEWDHFLSYVQGAEEELRKEQDAVNQAILSSFNADDVMMQKLKYNKVLGMIEALEWLKALPKAIKDNAVLAKGLLEEDPNNPK